VVVNVGERHGVDPFVPAGGLDADGPGRADIDQFSRREGKLAIQN
jgi:hypothetical protein